MQRIGQRVLGSEVFWTGLGLLLMMAASGAIMLGLFKFPWPMVVAGVVVAFGCVAIICNPYWGILLFVAILYLRPEQYFERLASMRLPMLLSSLTLFAWILQLLLKRETFRWRLELVWLGLFIAAIILSSYQVPGIELTSVAALDAVKLGLMFLLLQQLLNSERRAYTALHILLFCTVCLALNGIHGALSGRNVLDEHGMKRLIVAVGDFDDPNDLAAALVMVSPLALLLAWNGATARLRFAGGAALAILVFGTYLTNSRGGMLALATGMGVFLIHRIGWSKGAMIAIGGVALLLIFGPDRFSPESVQGDDSSMGRILAWRAGLGMFERSPLFGVGYEQFAQHHEITAHNTFIQTLGDGGLLLAMAWVGMNYWSVVTLFRVRRGTNAPNQDGVLPAYAGALFAGVLAAIVAEMFLSHAYRPVPLIPLAMASALGRLGNEHVDTRVRNLPHILAVPALTLAVIGVFYVITTISL